MNISIGKPNFADDFKDKIQKSTAKAVYSSMTELDDKNVLLKVYSQGRTVGVFKFNKDDTLLTLKKKHIIEKDYFPFEYCISEVVRYFKRKKIKNVEW